MSPDSSSRSRLYYGWSVMIVAAAAMVGTLPGRTQGLGLITEPLLADLHLDRVGYATLNLWATLLGSAGAVGIGQLVDRFGSRLVLTTVAVALGLVVCAMSQTTTFVGLAVWITLTRALGQSALSVVSLAIVGQWFVRRIDTAMAGYSVVISVGFMVAFPLVGSIVQQRGWRVAWLSIGCALVGVLAPLAWAVVRRGPEACGLPADGDGTPSPLPLAPVRRRSTQNPLNPLRDVSLRVLRALRSTAVMVAVLFVPRAAASRATRRDLERAPAMEGYVWSDALGTPAFWIFAAGTALYGLVASGIGLFNESILAQRGFGAEVYYQTLVVTALTALAGNFLGGWAAIRAPLGQLMAIALFVLSLGLVALPHVSTRLQVLAWAMAMGLGGGLVMVLFFSVWPRLFGRRHLGRIQGAAQALTVVASAVGPLLLAWCVERTGSYVVMFRLLAGVIAAVAAAAIVAPLPRPAPGGPIP